MFISLNSGVDLHRQTGTDTDGSATFDELICQSPPFHVLNALCRSRTVTSAGSGGGDALVYGLVPSTWTRPLTSGSCHHNGESGRRTTLRTEIETGGET